MVNWIIVCETPECNNFKMESPLTTEDDTLPVIVCGYCNYQYVNIRMI
jgi:hypothetical protein